MFKGGKARRSSDVSSPKIGRYIGLCLAFSLVVNLLLLVSPLYMLQVYDRIMTSGSMDALLWLSVVAIGLLSVYAAAEAGRRRVLSIAGEDLSSRLSNKIFQNFLTDSTSQARLGHDLGLVSRLQTTVQSGLPTALCDLPFTPLFLILLMVLHPYLGILGVAGALCIIVIAIIAQFHTKNSGQTALDEDASAKRFAQGLERQRSAIVSMGIGFAAKHKWEHINDRALLAATETSSIDGTYSGLSRTLRQILQVLALGIGAALAINQEISAGGIVAGSILMGRALSPIDHIVGGWRSLIRARTAWRELNTRISHDANTRPVLALPKPHGELIIQRLAVRIPGTTADLIRAFSNKVNAGEIVAILGGNGAGKTTLLQTLAGAWTPHDGCVRLGGRDIHDWPAEDRGQYVGYMPQDIELLPGTVSENISRFRSCDDADLYRATQHAGAHDAILHLQNGYDTIIGPGGQHLSAGQEQMIGLARALFKGPSAVFLDEPSANLDQQAVVRLLAAITTTAAAKTCVVFATHDPRLLKIADTVLIIRDGAIMRAPASDYLKAQHAQLGQSRQLRPTHA